LPLHLAKRYFHKEIYFFLKIYYRNKTFIYFAKIKF
jgi:hypothetical protein